MNPFFLVGAATVGVVGYTLKTMGRNDVLENPFPIRVCGERPAEVAFSSSGVSGFGSMTFSVILPWADRTYWPSISRTRSA